jgi:hypothetical protein
VDERRTRWLRRALFAAVLASACQRKQRPEAVPSSVTALPSLAPSAAPSAAVVTAPSKSGVPVVTNEHGETTCSVRDLGEFNGGRVVDREVYSFPKLNELLAKYPDFARASGLSEVKDCEGARLFARRYFAYKRDHPTFDHEGPSKAEQFEKFLSDPDNVARPGGPR